MSWIGTWTHHIDYLRNGWNNMFQTSFLIHSNHVLKMRLLQCQRALGVVNCHVVMAHKLSRCQMEQNITVQFYIAWPPRWVACKPRYQRRLIVVNRHVVVTPNLPTMQVNWNSLNIFSATRWAHLNTPQSAGLASISPAVILLVFSCKSCGFKYACEVAVERDCQFFDIWRCTHRRHPLYPVSTHYYVHRLLTAGYYLRNDTVHLCGARSVPKKR